MNNLRVRFLRMIPPGTRGKMRLARLLVESGHDASAATVSDRFGLTYAVPDFSEPIAFHLAVDGVYEPETLQVILSNLKEGGVFVDAGANIGAFTLPAARHVGKQGRVLAVEASPDIFSFLQRNIAANNADQVTSVNCALCDSNGLIPFYPAPVQKFGMGSLGAQFDSAPIQVPAGTLDRVLEEARIERVDVLKVDVEGFEMSVFKGALNLLNGPHPPLVVFEFCDWAEARVPNGKIGDAQRVLLDYGYSIWPVRDFIDGSPALARPIETDFAMLVARRAE